MLRHFLKTFGFRIDDLFLYDEDLSDWATDANKRIEQLRKKNVNNAFVFGEESSEDIQLEDTQRTHDFAFGSAVQSIQISNCLVANTEDSSFSKHNFNFMTDAYSMKWPKL